MCPYEKENQGTRTCHSKKNEVRPRIKKDYKAGGLKHLHIPNKIITLQYSWIRKQ